MIIVLLLDTDWATTWRVFVCLLVSRLQRQLLSIYVTFYTLINALNSLYLFLISFLLYIYWHINLLM